MSTVTRIISMLIVIAISARTMSYGLWVWRSENKPGALAVFLISLVTLALPVYMTFFKE